MAVAAPQTSASTQEAKQVKQFFDRLLLMRGKYALVHRQFGMKKSVPKGHKTIELRRYNRITVNATPEATYASQNAASQASAGYQLAEGTDPTSSDSVAVGNQTFTIDQVTGEPKQYGAYYAGTDLLEQVSYDRIRAEVAELLAQHAGETLDRVCRNQLITYAAASGTTQYAGNATTVNTVAPSHLLTYQELVEAVKTLMRNEAEPCKNGRYCAIISPETWATLMLDNDFREAVIHGGKDTMFTGALGSLPWVGVEFYLVKGNGAKREDGTLAGTNGVHTTLIFGKDGYAVLDWAGMGLESIFKAPGSAGTADPLELRWTQAWKASHVTIGVNGNWFMQLKHAVAIS